MRLSHPVLTVFQNRRYANRNVENIYPVSIVACFSNWLIIMIGDLSVHFTTHLVVVRWISIRSPLLAASKWIVTHTISQVKRKHINVSFSCSQQPSPNAIVSISVWDRIGQSPLHYAASCARVECCEILLDERLGLPTDQKDNNRHTPLMFAESSSYPGGSFIS